MIHLERIDHIVLTVADLQTTVQFYESVLGMRSESFGSGRIALKFGQQKLNLHIAGKEYEPKAHRPQPGTQDLCFIISTDINAAMKHVISQGVEIIEGPVDRTGATGRITSFYFRDPDLNLIEVARNQNQLS